MDLRDRSVETMLSDCKENVSNKDDLIRRGHQRGTLFQYESKKHGSEWKGRFRINITPRRRREVSITLGLVGQMTERQAREKLDQMVSRTHDEVGYVRHFGLRGLLKRYVSPNQAPLKTKLNMKAGHLRG